MSDQQVKVTDGRDMLSVPAESLHALEALGWERVDKAEPKESASRSRAK